MSGRGRGRGRGNYSGRNIAIDPTGMNPNQEEELKLVTQPPPIFPPLIHRAPKLEITDEWPYLFELKRDYAESLLESIYNIDDNKKKDIERWSDRLAAEMSNKSRYDKLCDWSVTPDDLKPRAEKRKKDEPTTQVKKTKEIDIQAKLAKLEAKEQTEKDPDDLEEEEKSSDRGDDEEVEAEEDPEEDEEMDEGTDYANNYFQTGEEDEEDDDNYEDGTY